MPRIRAGLLVSIVVVVVSWIGAARFADADTTTTAQGLVAWPTQEAGAILIGDVAPEQLAQLTSADLLAKTARRGAE